MEFCEKVGMINVLQQSLTIKSPHPVYSVLSIVEFIQRLFVIYLFPSNALCIPAAQLQLFLF